MQEGNTPPAAANVFAKGTQDMIVKEKKVELNVERIKYWLGVGAQPTRSAVKLLERVSRSRQLIVYCD